jgi:hypothetical protein
MRFRKLRISWSIGWGIVCVLLALLWARSFSTADEVYGQFPGVVDVMVKSYYGRLDIEIGECGKWPAWSHFSQPLILFNRPKTAIEFPGLTSFGTIRIPHWSLVATACVLVPLPWMRQLRWRFGLRTLLIATTLVAVMLGLVVWLSN